MYSKGKMLIFQDGADVCSHHPTEDDALAPADVAVLMEAVCREPHS
jgi:hypothetical protein